MPDFFQKSASLATQVLILLRRMHPHSVRSNDLLRKSLPDTNQLLYQLSYKSIFSFKWIARIELAPFVWKTNILTVIRYPQASERSACFLPLYIIIKEKHLLLNRPYRSRTYISSFVATYSIRYTNGPVPTERIELPTSSL